MKRNIGLSALTLVLCAGCVMVPQNVITLPGGYRIAAPKNVNIEDFEASFTNGALSGIKFKKWSSTNDSAVISKTAAGQVEMIKAAGEVAAKAVAASKGP